MLITQERMERFARECNDTNPIHYGKNAIAPALLTLSVAFSKIAKENPRIAIADLTTNFLKPVIAGQTLRAKYKLKDGHILGTVEGDEGTVLKFDGRCIEWKE